MADLSILAGATSQSIMVDLYVLATGAPQTALVFNSTGLTAYYSFTGTNGGSVQISLVTLSTVTSAYSSGGFKEIDATNMPGLYRLDLPNAAIAGSKGRQVIITVTGFSGMATRHIKLELTAVDNQSAAFGLSIAKTTNITGFNDIAASAVVSSGAITTSGGAVSTVTTTTNLTNAATAGDLTSTMKTSISGLTIATVTNLTNAPTIGDFTSTMKTSIGTAVAASAVASVTGSVGGNVTGSIGSLGTTAKTDVSTAVLTTQMTESYATLHTVPTLAQALFEQRALLAENSVSGTTVTTKKLDGSTSAHTYTINSSTVPTSITTAS